METNTNINPNTRKVKKVFRYFLQGLVYVAPIGITLYIMYLIFAFVDGLLKEYIENILHISIPGLGVLLLFIIISFLGYVGNSIVFTPIKQLINRLLDKAPILRTVYSAINDLFTALVGNEKKFNQPVLVRVNTISDLEKMGFVTQTDLTDLGIADKVAVYFPHSYNFSGEMFIVPREYIRKLDIPPSEAMKFIVSGGVTKVWLQEEEEKTISE